MKKRLGLGLLALLLIAAPAQKASASEAGIEIAAAAEEVVVAEPAAAAQEGESTEELLMGYFEQKVSENLTYGIAMQNTAYGWEKLGEKEKKLYALLLENCKKIAAGELSSTEFTITPKELGMPEKLTAADLGVSSLIAYDADGHAMISEEATKAASAVWTPNLSDVMRVMNYNHPYELYWYDKTSGAGRGGFGYQAGYDSSVGDYVLSIKGNFLYYMYVAKEYSAQDMVGTCMADTAKTKAASKAAGTVADIIEEAKAESDFGKLTFYCSKICDLVDYNTQAAGDQTRAYGNPWQLIWVFDGDEATKVVCEGYSKAFKYLCDRTAFAGDIACYTVTGSIGGAHMWNLVAADGTSYLADVTNCDSIGMDIFFMKGMEGSVEEGYSPKQYDYIHFVYDQGTMSLYDKSVLTLSAEDYAEKNVPDEGTGTKPDEGTGDEPQTVFPVKEILFSQNSFVYNGENQRPVVTVLDSQGNTIDPSNYTVVYPAEAVNAGIYPVSVDMQGNYTGTYSASYQITPKTLAVANVTLGSSSLVYNGKTRHPSVNVKDGTKKLTKGTDYTVAYTGGKNVGTYKVNVQLQGNYTGTITKTFRITPKTLTVANVTLQASSFVYNKQVRTPQVTVKDGTVTLAENQAYTVTYGKGRTNVGTYKVTVQLKGNYTGTVTKTFKITPKTLTAANVKLSGNSFVYNGKVRTPVVTVTDGTKKLVKDLGYTVAYGTGDRKQVGTYTVTIRMKANYTGTVKKTFQIKPKGTVIHTLGAQTKGFKVTFAKQAVQTTGYQVQYAANNRFTGASIKTIARTNTTSQTISGLQAKKTYYVRIRTYKTVNGKTYYSGWSAAKSVKTK